MILASLVTGCFHRASPAQLIAFPRAIVTKENVDSALRVESRYTARGDSLAPPGSSWFNIIRDTGVVLLVAPHATPPVRDGDVRFADGGSGSLAILLSRLTGSSVIYTTYRSLSDPNYYDDVITGLRLHTIAG